MRIRREVLARTGLLLALAAAACSGGGKGSSGNGAGSSVGTGGDTTSGASGGSGGSGGSESSTATSQGGTQSGGSGGGSGNTSSGGSSGSGGSGGSGGEGGACDDCEAGVSLDEFCENLADSVCDHLQRCLGFADRAACEAWPRWPTIVLTCTAGVDAVEEGRLSYDPVAGAECLAANDDPECEVTVPVVRAGMGLGPCADVFEGEVEAGGDCYPASTAIADECEAGTYCEGQCPGECVAETPTGQDCESSTECGVNSICDGVCEILPSEGEECDGQCRSGLLCLAATGTCELARQTGDECGAAGDCQTGFCVDDECAEAPGDGEDCFENDVCGSGLVCIDGTCFESVESGADCINDGNCPEGERCLNPMGEGYACQAPSELDEFCSQDADCASPLLCNWVDNVCASVGEESDPCEPLVRGMCAENLFCDRESETCQAPVGESEPCNPTAGLTSCEAGFYCECTDNPGCSSISSDPNDYDICVEQKADGEECSRAVECFSGACLNTLDGLVCGDPDDFEATACAGP